MENEIGAGLEAGCDPGDVPGVAAVAALNEADLMINGISGAGESSAVDGAGNVWIRMEVGDAAGQEGEQEDGGNASSGAGADVNEGNVEWWDRSDLKRNVMDDGYEELFCMGCEGNSDYMEASRDDENNYRGTAHDFVVGAGQKEVNWNGMYDAAWAEAGSYECGGVKVDEWGAPFDYDPPAADDRRPYVRLIKFHMNRIEVFCVDGRKKDYRREDFVRIYGECRAAAVVVLISTLDMGRMSRDFLTRVDDITARSFWNVGGEVRFEGHWCSVPMNALIRMFPSRINRLECLSYTIHVSGRLNWILDVNRSENVVALNELKELAYDCRLTDNQAYASNVEYIYKFLMGKEKTLQKVFLVVNELCKKVDFESSFRRIELFMKKGSSFTVLFMQKNNNEICGWMNEYGMNLAAKVWYRHYLNRSRREKYDVYNGMHNGVLYSFGFRSA